MVKLYDGGVWLVNGTELVEDGPDAAAAAAQMAGAASLDREEASRQTMAYSILEEHNTSGNMDDLKIKFDKLTSHDITLWGSFRRQGLQDWKSSQSLMC